MSINVFAGQADLTTPNEPLVGFDDFVEWFNLPTPDTNQTARIHTALEIASAVIRTRTCQQLSVTQSTVTVDSSDGDITLPQYPVITIDSVTQGGVALQVDTDYTTTLSDGFMVVTGPAAQPYVSPTVVTYTHGYNPLPRDIAGVCLSVAKRFYDNPDGREVQSETLGSWSASYLNPAGNGFTVAEEEIVSRYRLSLTY